MTKRPPITDWSTDFDHLDPRWVEDPFPIWDELRQRCPIAHTGRFMGVYFPSRYDDVRAIAYDTEHFSSRRVIVRETPPPLVPAPPITSDPPEHRQAKQVLLPPFTPDAIKLHEPRARKICRELLDRLAGGKGGDAATDYAQEIPARVIAHMLGVAEQDVDRFRKWIHEVLELGITDIPTLMRASREMQEFFGPRWRSGATTPATISSPILSMRASTAGLSPTSTLSAPCDYC
jgi:cytochrome P450